MEQTTRLYPVGIQTFSRIIKENYFYVDKTDLVWKLAHHATFVFISRPRRFGKSLLTSTLEAYFNGDKGLFKGLKIMAFEKEWKKYPVIHLDLSTVKDFKDADNLRDSLIWMMKPLAEIYGRDADETSPGKLLTGLITRAGRKTSSQVAVLIDEYDAPLFSVLHDNSRLDDMRNVMQEFYQPLKANESKIKFCFITGITHFSQINIFSALNNLSDISLLPEFSSICGITEDELSTQMEPDIKMLADEYGCTAEEMHDKLKERYDGYHFAGRSPEVYNPYSLLSAFNNKQISNYWFSTGTPTFLLHMMKRLNFNIMSVDNVETTDYAINRPTEVTSMTPLLYQTGYLTIKEFDREAKMYTLSIPNREVRIGYTDGLLPTYSGLEGEDVQTGFALKFWRALKAKDINLAMQHMQSYLASIPYVEGFKKKLAEAATKEGFYEYTFYLIFSMLNVYVRTQVKVAGGRTDMVVFMPDTIYVMELKIADSAKNALEQINKNGYADPYLADGRKIVKIGIRFNPDKHTVDEWIAG